MKKLEKISGMWKQQDQSGNTYLSGKYNDKFFLILRPNTKKKDKGSPDFILYRSPSDQIKGNWKPKVKRSVLLPPGHRANLKPSNCQICGYNVPFCCHCFGDKDENKTFLPPRARQGVGEKE